MIESKRHQDALRSRMDEVIHRGYAVLHRFELYAWYGRKRLTQNVYRDVLSTYREMVGAKKKLSVLSEEEGGTYLLLDPTRIEPAERAFGIEED